MLYFETGSTDPAYNQAFEEYVLTHRTVGDILILWQNDNAVIIGRNQNTAEEINQSFVDAHGIHVVRRNTGGGAVYHDLNNICYTVIAPYNGEEDTYRRFTAPVIEYLNSLGVKAEFAGRNDILVDGKKISGNAQTVKGGRIMHHGTLLFNTDMSVLEGALRPNKLKIESKGIKSVRARVTNIKDHLINPMTLTEFKAGLAKKFSLDCDVKEFTEEEILKIKKLADEKYSNYEWNIGKSPKGKNKFEKKFDFGIFTITFDTDNGVMKSPEIYGDFFALKDLSPLCARLDGVKFSIEGIRKALKGVGEFIKGADENKIVDAFFESEN
jgi:lipoate-protein ligase A